MRRPGARAALVLGAALAALAAMTGPVARADTLADRRAEADRVQAQLDVLDARLERTTEAYNAARQRLADTGRAIRLNERELKVTEQNLTVASDELAAELVNAYRRGSPDAIQLMLTAGSIGDMLDRMDLARRVSAHTAALVHRVLVVKGDVQARAAALAAQRRKRAAALADTRRRRAELQGGIAERQGYLASVKADIRQIIAAREAAAAAAARQQRERRRSQLAAAKVTAAAAVANDPGVGGSGGGDGAGTASETSGGGAIVPPSGTGSGAADAALSQLGVAYVWAGSSPGGGFDCSGLVMWAYAQVGVSLPHNASAQHGSGTPVDRSALQPGDLVFFDGDGHVGIYIGGGQFVHAPHTGDVVKVSNLDGYPGYNGAVRIL
jgi:cell wall-associated NlpC family hydrolase